MDLTVKKVAEMAGITVRTLHHFDAVGLLHPSRVSAETGYRYYNEKDLEQLEQILYFRELDIPLKEIKRIIRHPAYDRRSVLEKHKTLVTLKRDRLNRLIERLEKTLAGKKHRHFKEFDMSEIEQVKNEYAAEAEARWGHTDAWEQSRRKTAQYGPTDWERIKNEAAGIYKGFADHMDKDVYAPEVLDLVRQWQRHITENFYECTDEILAGLGRMYVADERFTKNIDRFGTGLAEFMSRAIARYCSHLRR